MVPHNQHSQRDILFLPVGTDPACGIRRELEQCFDRLRRAGARTEFKDLTQQYQCCDDGCGFEINRHAAARGSETRRHNSRRQRCDQAVAKRYADSERDQSEHIQMAGAHRRPTAFEKWPARPQHHGRCQKQLKPLSQWPVQGHRDQTYVCAHFEEQ